MILQEISDKCDRLPAALREEKERQHYTYPQIAQATGVPEHTVGKFFSGTLANPSVFHVAAYCILLHVSLDSLFGIANPQTDSQLRQELAVTKMALAKTEEQVSIYKSGIKERKPLIYGLCGLCIALFLMLATYICLDALAPSMGLIQQGSVSPVIVVGGFAVICACLYLAHTIVKRGAEKMNCPKCKKAAPEEAAFCPWCGKRLTAQERKHRKRANGTGTVCRLSGNRAKPWMARKNDVLIGTFETRSEALKALERLTDTQVNELYNLTFEEVYERWKREHGREITEKLLKNYELAYTQCESLHGQKMRSLRRSDYQAAVIALEEQGMSKSTCNKLRTMLRQVCGYAQMEGILHSNPADDLNTVARQKTVREIFTDEDIQKIKASSLPAAQLALIMISCGCRPGELFTVPLANCGKDHMIWGSKTEAGKNRVIPIGPDGVEAYQTLTILSTAKGGTLLVDGYKGSHTTENFRRRDWAQLMREIGREDLTPYSCRHTFITRAIRGGIDLISLEAIVGHVDKETTKLYTHLRASDLVTAVRDSAVKNAVSNKSATRQNGQISKAV